MTKRYDLYFGSCDHIRVWCHLKYSYHVLMFGDPLGDTLSFRNMCSVHKSGMLLALGPREK